MISPETEEKLAEYLVQRIQEANTFILEKIGETIKQISTIKPTDAYKLGQILKYGGSYEEIAKELARVSGKNVQDIYKIFEEIAKDNKAFAKQFYEYRGIDYIPYEQDLALQRQVKSIAELTAQTYLNISRTTGVGFIFKDVNGQMYFKDIKQSYNEIVDRAIMSISQGKETFQNEMRRIMKQLGNSGIVQYESGRTRRLDSAIRMNVLDGIRQLNMEITKRFGEEYGADGVEITAHKNPAPDHEDIQGRQFKNEEFEKLEQGLDAVDVKGHKYIGADRRHIAEYNCYHRTINIIVGIIEPRYSDEQLKEMQQTNTEGFMLDGKHYTMYEGTQLQRKLELAIRKKKDTQILARSSGDIELAKASELKIRQITNKYNELCRVSGLRPLKQRMAIPGYRRIKVA